MKLKLPERRRFIRIEIPLKVTIMTEGRVDEVVTKNISPIGMRFEIAKELSKTEKLDMTLSIPSSEGPAKLTGRVVWQNKTSLEDNAPYDVGVEIIEIEDTNKNLFLKYLCDLLYESTFKARY
jgi:c-di-GMP-binding flagellar brake protein YcgR